MPPRGVRSAKRVRQYEQIMESEQRRGRSPRRAKEIAAATVNKQRAEASETKRSTRRSLGSSKTTASRTRSRTRTTTRTASSRKKR